MTEHEQLQATFDMVARHLLEQGRQASFLGRCAYRGSDGTKCAVGCLIPDERYDAGMEGIGVRELLRRCPIALGRAVSKRELDLLHALQSAHDRTATSPYAVWPEGSIERQRLLRTLGSVALEFGLNADVLSGDAP